MTPPPVAYRLTGTTYEMWTLTSLSAQIGIGHQETYLFNEHIRTNLLYGKLDATQVRN